MLFVLLIGQVSLLAQKDYALLPKPQQMEVKGGNFLLNQVKLNTPVLALVFISLSTAIAFSIRA